MAFVVFIGGIVGNIFYSRQRRAHNEIIEVYKSQILLLESELDYYKRDKEKYELLLLTQLGLMQERAEMTEQKPVHKAMSPLRMRQSLEVASRSAIKK